MPNVTPHMLAVEFCRVLRDWLTPEQLDAINHANSTEFKDSPICASHDYCDPNQAMLDAMEVFGIELDCQSDEQCRLIELAWDIANKSGFTLGYDLGGCNIERKEANTWETVDASSISHCDLNTIGHCIHTDRLLSHEVTTDNGKVYRW